MVACFLPLVSFRCPATAPCPTLVGLTLPESHGWLIAVQFVSRLGLQARWPVLGAMRKPFHLLLSLLLSFSGLSQFSLSFFTQESKQLKRNRNTTHSSRAMQTKSPRPPYITWSRGSCASDFSCYKQSTAPSGIHKSPTCKFQLVLHTVTMAGLVKAKKYDWKDSNLALFGSDLERNARALAS